LTGKGNEGMAKVRVQTKGGGGRRRRRRLGEEIDLGLLFFFFTLQTAPLPFVNFLPPWCVSKATSYR